MNFMDVFCEEFPVKLSFKLPDHCVIIQVAVDILK